LRDEETTHNESVRAALLLVVACAGCAARGFFTDGTSVSFGSSNNGALRHGRALPGKGEGYLVPALWRARGSSFGTDEIVAAIQRAARRVAREYPGGTLGVGDLSPRGGGDSKLHRSHENGRDADLIYFAVDARGRPVAPADAMPRYGADLVARAPSPTEGVTFGPFAPRRFDVPRNWALVRALLEDPRAEVQFLFCHAALKEKLLEHARAIGEDEALVARAEAILRQPGDSLPHDDHLHLRIYCAADDRAQGCVDRGPARWWKKRWKYMAPERPTELDEAIARLVVAPYLPSHFVP
jgi:penicillin-insensitive murein endopeptidase